MGTYYFIAIFKYILCEKYLWFICFVSYDHPNVIEGQGTIGIEIIEQVPDVDAVIVPVGGGSLLCGIAVAVKHLKPDTEVYVRNSYLYLYLNLPLYVVSNT